METETTFGSPVLTATRSLAVLHAHGRPPAANPVVRSRLPWARRLQEQRVKRSGDWSRGLEASLTDYATELTIDVRKHDGEPAWCRIEMNGALVFNGEASDFDPTKIAPR